MRARSRDDKREPRRLDERQGTSRELGFCLRAETAVPASVSVVRHTHNTTLFVQPAQTRVTANPVARALAVFSTQRAFGFSRFLFLLVFLPLLRLFATLLSFFTYFFSFCLINQLVPLETCWQRPAVQTKRSPNTDGSVLLTH